MVSAELSDAEMLRLQDAVMDDKDRAEGFVVTGPGGTDGNTPTLFEVVESIKAAAYRAGGIDALREAAKEIYNGAGDPEQAFYDYGLHPWLTARADQMGGQTDD